MKHLVLILEEYLEMAGRENMIDCFDEMSLVSRLKRLNQAIPEKPKGIEDIASTSPKDLWKIKDELQYNLMAAYYAYLTEKSMSHTLFHEVWDSGAIPWDNGVTFTDTLEKSGSGAFLSKPLMQHIVGSNPLDESVMILDDAIYASQKLEARKILENEDNKYKGKTFVAHNIPCVGDYKQLFPKFERLGFLNPLFAVEIDYCSVKGQLKERKKHEEELVKKIRKIAFGKVKSYEKRISKRNYLEPPSVDVVAALPDALPYWHIHFIGKIAAYEKCQSRYLFEPKSANLPGLPAK